jgi:Flp pilus assembly secretin CpaC
MTHRSLVTLAAALALAALAGLGRAQEEPKAAEAKDSPKADRRAERRLPGATLRVQVVISRFDGDKKVASLPYTFNVNADGRSARMRMGVDTPIPVTTTAGAPATYQYRTVGTNLDCSARDLGDGRYQLQISVENSSALAGTGSTQEGMPLFRRFDTNLDPLLRDGQGTQVITSTDPVTGEVMKIDVTLNVVK